MLRDVLLFMGFCHICLCIPLPKLSLDDMDCHPDKLAGWLALQAGHKANTASRVDALFKHIKKVHNYLEARPLSHSHPTWKAHLQQMHSWWQTARGQLQLQAPRAPPAVSNASLPIMASMFTALWQPSTQQRQPSGLPSVDHQQPTSQQVSRSKQLWVSVKQWNLGSW